MKKELNQEQVDILASLVSKELESIDQRRELGRRFFRKLSKILSVLKNETRSLGSK